MAAHTQGSQQSREGFVVLPFSLELARKEKVAAVWAEVVLKNDAIDKDEGRQKLQLVHHLSVSALEDVCA